MESRRFVGTTRGATNALSVLLNDAGRNPWGVYEQKEPCMHCGSKLIPPANRTFGEKVCGAVAERLNRLQQAFVAPRGNWIHMVFSRS